VIFWVQKVIKENGILFLA